MLQPPAPPQVLLRLFLKEKTPLGRKGSISPRPKWGWGQPRQHQAIPKPPKLQRGAPHPPAPPGRAWAAAPQRRDLGVGVGKGRGPRGCSRGMGSPGGSCVPARSCAGGQRRALVQQNLRPRHRALQRGEHGPAPTHGPHPHSVTSPVVSAPRPGRTEPGLCRAGAAGTESKEPTGQRRWVSTRTVQGWEGSKGHPLAFLGLRGLV